MKDFYQVIILTFKRFTISNSNYLIIHTPIFLLNNNEIKRKCCIWKRKKR